MIFTIQPHPNLVLNPGSQKVFNQMFNTRILHLTPWDVDGVSHETWECLKQKIITAIKTHDIDLVIFDRTGEPGVLNAVEGYGPNDLTIRTAVEQYCRCVIITDDYHFFYNPDPNVIFFPYNLWLPATRSIHLYYRFQNTVYDCELQKTKPIMCLNRNLMWHRLYLFLQLVKRSWFPKVDYSFINTLDQMHRAFLQRDLDTAEFDQLQTYADLFPIQLPDEVNKKVAIGYQGGANSVNIPVYQNNAMNLVTETSINHGTAFTEKTAKVFMAYQIPCLIAAAKANEFLHDMGLDMFEDYVPWRAWDAMTDHKTKINMIVDFVDGEMRRPDKILQNHAQWHSRLVKNKQVFHSEEFAKKLTDQIRNFKL